ncbi:uncharacterized protein B0H18DRAFT_963433, partial [Fomitopsis serialis]|uniref:uncharacterized protein n=1 Tax=Fomitopsis serialis TaxID=139415 RepID=UPI0020078B6E
LPSYGITAHYAQECPENPEINHVTVVCLERKNFGVLFDYLSHVQGNKQDLRRALGAIDALDPPATLGMGAVGFYSGEPWGGICADVSSGASVQSCGGDNALRAGQASAALFAPHMGCTRQRRSKYPFTTQLLRGLNEWKSHEQPLGMSFDLFSVDANAFIPACLHVVPFRLPFPLKHVPVFKESNVALTEDAGDYSRGLKPLVPMCSMTASFMAFDFVWPMDVPQRRQCLKADWHIEDRGSSDGTVAVRPLIGEEDCTVQDLQPHSEVEAGTGQAHGEAQAAGAKDDREISEILGFQLDGREITHVDVQEEVEIWEILSEGSLIPCELLHRAEGPVRCQCGLGALTRSSDCPKHILSPHLYPNMPTPRNVDERLFKIFALTVTTTLDEVWSTSRHATSATRWTMLQSSAWKGTTSCLMDGTDVCPMELSSTQIDTEDRELMVEAANQPHDPPLKFGGWVLMGAVPECYEDWKRSRPLLNYQWPPYVAETQGPQGRAALDALLPVSIPLIGIIEPTGFAINIPGPEEQPLLVQPIPGLNPFKNPRPPTPSYDLYNAASQTFVPADMTDAFPIRLSLPLDHVLLLGTTML